MTRNIRFVFAALAMTTALYAPSTVAGSYLLFESGQVRPLALSSDGTRLVAVNTPDNRLEIFSVGADGLVLEGSVKVGLEPVAVALRTDTEAWVVNHLSDSISIVDLSATPKVSRTLLTGDEPRDIVFAGAGGNRAFVTTAHRGQHRSDASISGVTGAGDPQLTAAGIGRADVWVFDGANPGAGFGGTPLKIIELFGDTPRALTVSPDGNTVYAAIFMSGNLTAVVNEGTVCNGFGAATCAGDGVTSPNGLAGGLLPGGLPGPSANVHGDNAPETGLVVKYDTTSGEWRDTLGRNWSNGIRFDLPDKDVFAINAATLNETAFYQHVGTTIFNMAVNPVSGKVYVSNTEAINEVRFEGPGSGGSTVQGNLAQSRITVLDGANIDPRHLNKHIDYSQLPAPAGTKDHSLATPVGMAVSPDGATLYVAAFGSGRIGVFDTTSLEDNSFNPTTASANYIALSGGGPTGMTLNSTGDRLFVLTRFDNAVAMIDTANGSEISKRALHNPEPQLVVDGRPFLYDANLTSSNGEASCSSCHIFGDMDGLAWDLGDPDGEVIVNPIEINLSVLAAAAGLASPTINGSGAIFELHPMKGPMTTQTLRGMVNSGAMHWRGDRSVGVFGTDAFDSLLSFKNFNVAFPGLVGRDAPFSEADITKFALFALELTLPPNPVRALNNSLTTEQQAGADFYSGSRLSDGVPFEILGTVGGFTCNGCHTLDPSQGFFGTGGKASFENEEQTVKIPHLRNMYQKVGMFGMPNVEFFRPGDNSHRGDQVRGTGFLHDGGTDSLFRFFNATVFDEANFGELVGFPDDQARLDMEQFMHAFDTDLAPIVGQQITLTSSNATAVNPRIDLLLQRAAVVFTSKILGGVVTEADVVAHGYVDGAQRAWLYHSGTGTFSPDNSTDATIDAAALRALVDGADERLTFTAVPPGSGTRMAHDRDEDGVLNGDDVCPAVADAAQADSDFDGVGDLCDSCTLVANSDQRDTNGDGYGNACDADLTNDGVVNPADLGLLRSVFFDTGDLDADFNGDGVVNPADLGIMRAAFFGTPGPSALAP